MEFSLILRIESSSPHTKNRIENANFFLENQHLINDLIDYSFNIKYKSHFQACCILDKVVEFQLDLIIPFLDEVCSQIENLKNDSAIRSISRILRFIVIDNNKKLISDEGYLTKFQIEKITTCAFDWLISDFRVAVKHSAIKILYVLGKNQKWIHQELRIVLEKDAAFHSIGYKTLAKKILKEI